MKTTAFRGYIDWLEPWYVLEKGYELYYRFGDHGPYSPVRFR